MPTLMSFLCGFVFGLGLTISGMIQPTKVIGFLDFFGIPSGTWDPSLAVVMAAALTATGIGYAFIARRAPPFAKDREASTKKDIDRPLLAGAALFGLGWGLVGLCPGPAIVNLWTLSIPVLVFVFAMAIGILAHDVWAARAAGPIQAADG